MVKSLDDNTKNYAGLNFVSHNLLDSAAGGTFMEITLGEATKLLDNIMENYTQLLGNVVISKKFLRTRKIMVMHSNERGECVHVPS